MKPEMHDGWGMHDPRQEGTGDREAYLPWRAKEAGFPHLLRSLFRSFHNQAFSLGADQSNWGRGCTQTPVARFPILREACSYGKAPFYRSWK